MRILFVTPYVPSHIRVRPFHFIKLLSTMHEIALVTLVCDEYERELVNEVAPYCSSLDMVPLPKWQAYAHCLGALPTTTPLRVAYYRSAAFVACLQKVMARERTELIHGELIKTVPALQQLAVQTHTPIVYDAVDCISSYLMQQWQSISGIRNPLKKAFVYSELQKMRRYEPKALARFEQVLITAEHDRNYLYTLGVPTEQLHVVPNGVDTEYFTPPNGPRAVDTLVFCAKMDYYPNAQGIVTFCHDVLPHIWKSRPQTRLTIVGNNPPSAVRALARDTRITVTGYVPDIRPYLGTASVALAPLHVAAGMQNKVLEALAMGTPMVATPTSCRALQVVDGEQLLLAKDNASFAESVLRLLVNPQLAQQLGQAGRHYVEEQHSWTSAIHTLNTLYQGLSFASTWHPQGMPLHFQHAR